jgi:transcriptional/translational regulatory protein YebC/TACO1
LRTSKRLLKDLETKGFKSVNAELTRIPENTIEVTDVQNASWVVKLLEKLEEHDDVQNVYANCDIPDEVMEQIDA